MPEMRTDTRWPAGLAVEHDEDGPTQAGSTVVKRVFIDHVREAGIEGDMPHEIRSLGADFPEEYGEVMEQFEAAPGTAYR